MARDMFFFRTCARLCTVQPRLLLGGPGAAIRCHSTAGRLQELKSAQLWSKKERKDACYSKGDKHKGGNLWHHYNSIFWSKQLCWIYSRLLSFVWHFSVLWHTVSFTPSAIHGFMYSIPQMRFHLLCHLLVHFNCLEKSLYPVMSASH